MKSLRSYIAENEKEYSYTIQSCTNLHDPEAINRVGYALLGKSVREVRAGSVRPYSGTKSDAFPDQVGRSVYELKIKTGLPLTMNAGEEIAMVLNSDPVIVVGKEWYVPNLTDVGPEAVQEEPVNDAGSDVGVKRLGDFFDELESARKERDKETTEQDVYEGFVVTQIEAHRFLGEGVPKGYYVVRKLDESGRSVSLVGPFEDVPVGYVMDHDLIERMELREAELRRYDDLLDYRVELYSDSWYTGETKLMELQAIIRRPYRVMVKDQDSGKTYGALVDANSDVEARNIGLQKIAREYALNPDNLLVLDPVSNGSQFDGQQSRAA